MVQRNYTLYNWLNVCNLPTQKKDICIKTRGINLKREMQKEDAKRKVSYLYGLMCQSIWSGHRGTSREKTLQLRFIRLWPEFPNVRHNCVIMTGDEEQNTNIQKFS